MRPGKRIVFPQKNPTENKELLSIYLNQMKEKELQRLQEKKLKIQEELDLIRKDKMDVKNTAEEENKIKDIKRLKLI